MAKKSTLDDKIDLLISVVGKGLAVILDHSKVVEENFNAMAHDVQTFDNNLHTFYKNTEQRFNAIHLQLDTIEAMLARIHHIGDPPAST